MADPVRFPLAVQNDTRDAGRAKDSWGVNCFLDGQRARPRPGFTQLLASQETGLGLLAFGNNLASLQNTSGTNVLTGNWVLEETDPTLGNINQLGIGLAFDGSSVWALSSNGTNVTYYKALSSTHNFVLQATSTNIFTDNSVGVTAVTWFGGTLVACGAASDGSTVIITSLNTVSGVETLKTMPDTVVGNLRNLKDVGLAVVGNTLYLAMRGADNKAKVWSTTDLTTWALSLNTADTTHGFQLLSANSSLYLFPNGSGTVTVYLFVSSWVPTSMTIPASPGTPDRYFGYATGIGLINIDTFNVYSASAFFTFDLQQSRVVLLPGYLVGGLASGGGAPYGPDAFITVGDRAYAYTSAIGSAPRPLSVQYTGQLFPIVITVGGSTPYDIITGYLGSFLKNTTNAYFYNGATLTAVTDVNYPALTVRGAAFLDGTYYVMTPTGQIFGSRNLNDSLHWDPLNVIVKVAEPDAGVALTRLLNYVVAFGAYSLTFFYDAGNPVGSPLLPYTSALTEIGCAAAGSVAQPNNSVVFMGVARQKGRSIYMLKGTTPEPISTPAIDRILNGDNLASVTSFVVKIQGAEFYVLTLGTSNITLVCDLTTRDWKEWSSLVVAGTQTPAGATYANGVVTVHLTGHGLASGDPVTLAGWTQSGYNGSYLVTVVDADHFSYQPLSTPSATPATGSPALTSYVETAFIGQAYVGFGSVDYFQDSTGSVYSLDAGVYSDGAAPLSMRVRTTLVDFSSVYATFTESLDIVSDKGTAFLYLRYTGDDYATWSNWIPVLLSTPRSRIRRVGTDNRRAYEAHYIDAVPMRLESLEIRSEKGSA